jgi:hypothetical protein
MDTQREIKFRAWDKEEKKFYYYNLSNLWVNGFDCGLHKAVAIPVDNTPVQQYTGLHDRNNVEIYEGDYLKDFGYVEFRSGEYWIITNGSKPDMKLVDFIIWVEVIGNIYENKDLLKVQQG